MNRTLEWVSDWFPSHGHQCTGQRAGKRASRRTARCRQNWPWGNAKAKPGQFLRRRGICIRTIALGQSCSYGLPDDFMFDVVRFSPTAIEDQSGQGVSFVASVDGRPVKCSISAEALETYFHADPSAHEQAYARHREEIEEAAEALIQTQGISSGELRIGLADLNGSIVAFGRSVRSPHGTHRVPLKG